MHDDIRSIKECDPAGAPALGLALLSGPLGGVIHRVSHWLWRRKLRLPARILSQVARFYTGVDIHPAR